MSSSEGDMDATAALKGSVPQTKAIPEPPRHLMLVTSGTYENLYDGEFRAVDSSFFDRELVGQSRKGGRFRYFIVRCGVCGETFSETAWQMPETVFEDLDMHNARRHIGSKVVWLAADIPADDPDDLVDISQLDIDTDDYIYRAAGYVSVSRAGELARRRLRKADADEYDVNPETAELVVLVEPPFDPFPDGPDADEERRVEVISPES